ncbi:hypothetical protein C7M61_004708 [Candidozyma pseudohaemuli]|uniref:Lariat debranching enzyme C-terminal domain-containing protein n=1 Tax=Candidozyma pseudohaemuli TaxID=418784 RepID=A0A2P7YH08_9ASCO|nr:hypothetical protein C7M61_004708 [[Candida] pseudohaemulonii]PSK35250.1 hypothetical protein C7M61_004708 [[Candida] pseudohaemulonii]
MVHVAVEGCGHGALDAIYRSLRPGVELLIICGDFQALRNITDLDTISVPPKYKQLGDFADYYSGKKKAPVLTIFIGGNHECSSYLRELQYGGWVAPNIYYLGEFGSVWFKGIRISGMLGIWNGLTFYKKRTENYLLPYNPGSLRLAYHVKPKNLLKLLLSGKSDIVLSHDWPKGIWQYGDERSLLRKKKFFKEDMQSGKLGSPAARAALEKLVPPHWFSLHLHVKFTAQFEKDVKESDDRSNESEISLDMDGDSNEIELDMDDTAPKKLRKVTRKTSFLALDKCLPRRAFLDYVDVEPRSHTSTDSELLFYDPQALAAQKIVESFIKENTDQWLALDPQIILDSGHCGVKFVEELEEKVLEAAKEYTGEDLEVSSNFERVAPSMLEDERPPLQYWSNPQTEEMCKKFNLPLPSHV